jgi:hypothetical protein
MAHSSPEVEEEQLFFLIERLRKSRELFVRDLGINIPDET